MTAPLNISRTAIGGRHIIATSVSVSSRRARGQRPQAPLRALTGAPADPIRVPLSAAQPGITTVNATAIMAQEAASIGHADVSSHSHGVAAYPSQVAGVEVLSPGEVSAAPMISINVRA